MNRRVLDRAGTIAGLVERLDESGGDTRVVRILRRPPLPPLHGTWKIPRSLGPFGEQLKRLP